MPTYEYSCSKCEVEFEELLISSDEIQKYSKEFPCPLCRQPCGRVPSAANFNFAGKAFGDPTNKKGSTGVHDLDYPSLDKAIGRSSKRKWGEYGKRKEARDAVRRETGSVAVSESRDGQIVATDAKTLDAREKGLKLIKKAKQQAG